MSDLAPPPELATWIGSSALVAGLGWALRSFFGRVGEAEKGFRDEVRAQLEKLNAGMVDVREGALVSKTTLGVLLERVGQVEKRQEEQARAHLERIDDLREELERRLQAHEDRCPLRDK